MPYEYSDHLLKLVVKTTDDDVIFKLYDMYDKRHKRKLLTSISSLQAIVDTFKYLRRQGVDESFVDSLGYTMIFIKLSMTLCLKMKK